MHSSHTINDLQKKSLLSYDKSNNNEQPLEWSFRLRQRQLFEMTVFHEKFEVEVFKAWGRLEAESR
jgi:hypothetical protein